jgi:hypothetical protein
MKNKEQIISEYKEIQDSKKIGESILYGIKNFFLLGDVYNRFKEIEYDYKTYVSNMNRWLLSDDPIHIELYIVHSFFCDLFRQSSSEVKYLEQEWYGEDFKKTSTTLCKDMGISDIRYFFNQASLSLPKGVHHSSLDHAFDYVISHK